MKRTALLAVFTLVGCAPAAALYCGGSIVQAGDTQQEVVQKCGQPADAAVMFGMRPGGGWSPWLKDHPLIANYGIYYDLAPFAAGVTEEWIYNFGPTRMMPRLIFENGVLTTIRYHGYGR